MENYKVGIFKKVFNLAFKIVGKNYLNLKNLLKKMFEQK